MIPTDFSVSLVTTVLNDLAGVERLLARMRAQTRVPNEIVIVDGGSRDGTWETLQATSVASEPRVVALQEFGCNVARGRNLAVATATHQLIVSTDVGCDWDPEWFEELVEPLMADPEVEMVVGSWGVRMEELDGPWAKTEWALRANYLVCRARPDSQITTRTVAFRKTTWLRLGGLPEDLTLAADDLVFDKLVKATKVPTAAAPEVRCYWHRHRSLRGFRKETVRYFFGNGEAGITAAHFVLVGGRIAVEAALLSGGGLALWFAPTRSPAVVALGLVLASFVLRLRRWLSASHHLAALGVDRPLGRVAAFDTLARLDSVCAYARGWWHGRTYCRQCRARLRAARAR